MATRAEIQTALEEFNRITGAVTSENLYTGEQFMARIQSILGLILSDEEAQTLIDNTITGLNLSQYQTQQEVADAISTAIAGISAGTDTDEVNRLITEALTNYLQATDLKPYALATGRQIQSSDIADGVIPSGFAHTSYRGHWMPGTYEVNDVVHWGTIWFLSRTNHTSGAGDFPENNPTDWEVLGHWKGPYHAQYNYRPGDLVSNGGIVYLQVANSARQGVTPSSANPLVWSRVTGFTEADIKRFAGEKIIEELADGGDIDTAIDAAITAANIPTEARIREIADEEATPLSPALQRFSPVADKTRTIINKISEQHTATTQVAPTDEHFTSYYSEIGDATPFSATNPDGVVASAGVTRAGNEILGLEDLDAPASASEISRRELYVTGKFTYRGSAIEFFQVKTGQNGALSTFTPFVRVNAAGELQVNRVQTEGVENWVTQRDAHDNSVISFTQNDETAFEIVAYKLHDGSVEFNVEVRTGSDRVRVSSRTERALAPGFDTSAIFHGGSVVYEVGVVTDELIRHDDESALFYTPTTNELRLNGKVRASVHDVTKDSYDGTLSATRFEEDGNRLATRNWVTQQISADPDSQPDTATIQQQIREDVLEPAREADVRWGKSKLPTDTVYDADIADFLDEGETDARIDRRIDNADIPSTGTNNESTTNAPSRQATKKYVDSRVNTRSATITVSGSPQLARRGDHVINGTDVYLALSNQTITTSTDFSDTTIYQPVGGGQDPRIPNSSSGSPFLVAGSGNNFQNSTEQAVAGRLRQHLVSNDRIADPASTTIAPSEDAVKAYVDANAGSPVETFTQVSTSSVTSAANTYADTGFDPSTTDADILYRLRVNAGNSTRYYTAAELRELPIAVVGDTTSTVAGTNIEFRFGSSTDVDIPLAIDASGNLLIATTPSETFTFAVDSVANATLVENGATIRSKAGIPPLRDGTAGQVWKLNSAGTAMEWADDNAGSGGSGNDPRLPSASADDTLLQWDSAASRWQPRSPADIRTSIGAASTSDLPDTTLSSLANDANGGAGPSEGDVVKWVGGEWVAAVDNTGSGGETPTARTPIQLTISAYDTNGGVRIELPEGTTLGQLDNIQVRFTTPSIGGSTSTMVSSHFIVTLPAQALIGVTAVGYASANTTTSANAFSISMSSWGASNAHGVIVNPDSSSAAVGLTANSTIIGIQPVDGNGAGVLLPVDNITTTWKATGIPL